MSESMEDMKKLVDDANNFASSQHLLDRILEAANSAGIDNLESLIAWLPVMQFPDEAAEPAAHMFLCDLERFQTVGEHTATAYSLEVGSPTHGETVPVFRHPPAKLPIQVNENAAKELAERLRAEIASTVKVPLADEAWVLSMLHKVRAYGAARASQDSPFVDRQRAIDDARRTEAELEALLRKAIPEVQPWICYADQKPDRSHVDDENAIWVSVEGHVKRTSLKALATLADWHGSTQVHWKPTHHVRPTPFAPERTEK